MLTSIHIQGIQTGFKRPALFFIFSLAFLPLPVILGGSFLREMLERIQSIFAFGLSAGDQLLMIGMFIGAILLIAVPLAGFAWGQVLAWVRKEHSSSVLLAYACLSVAYFIVSVSIIGSSLS